MSGVTTIWKSLVETALPVEVGSGDGVEGGGVCAGVMVGVAVGPGLAVGVAAMDGVAVGGGVGVALRAEQPASARLTPMISNPPVTETLMLAFMVRRRAQPLDVTPGCS
jgi:hypothetical protein